MTLTVAEFLRTRFSPDDWLRGGALKGTRVESAVWPAHVEPLWAAVPSLGEPTAQSFTVIGGGAVRGSVDDRTYAVMQVLCWYALRAEPHLTSIYRSLTGSLSDRRSWQQLVAVPDAARWLAVLAYRAEALQVGCRGLLAAAFTDGSGVVPVRSIRDDLLAPLHADLKWWGVPRRGWDPRMTAAQLTAAPLQELDSRAAATTAGWKASDQQHCLGLRLPAPAAAAPFLVATKAPSGSAFPAVLTNCGSLHR